MSKSISVITVVYNNAGAIRETIESVLSQSFRGFEYILIDGGSSDGTLEIVNEYRDRIDVVISEKDSGIFNAMNKGTCAASGTYVNFMNSGDSFADNTTLEKLYPVLSSMKYDVVYGDINVRKPGFPDIVKAAPEQGIVKHHMPFCHQSAFVKRSLLKQYGFDERYRLSADFKFFKQCFLSGCSFHKAPVVVCNFDKAGLSNTQRALGIKENMDIIRSLDRFPKSMILFLRSYLVLSLLRLRRVFKRSPRGKS